MENPEAKPVNTPLSAQQNAEIAALVQDYQEQIAANATRAASKIAALTGQLSSVQAQLRQITAEKVELAKKLEAFEKPNAAKPAEKKAA